ncbi:hypothetical protein F2P79_014023 [Pimephales promelas]|nr:hypothetical protein F2P79_014023 [Pimephales promelas]
MAPCMADRRRCMKECRNGVNLAFLDRLGRQEVSRSDRVSEPVTQTPENRNVGLDDADEPQDTAFSPVPNPSWVHTDSAEEDDRDHMWTLMKLQNDFPYYEREMLEDIVKQCNGNYNHAYELLNV